MKSFKIDMFINTEVNVTLSENFHNIIADGMIFINRNLCDWQSAKAILRSSRFKEALEKLNVVIVHAHAVAALNIISKNWTWTIRWRKMVEND